MIQLLLDIVIHYLQKHPIWGWSGAAVSSATPILLKIEQVPVFLTITGAAFGIILSVLTIYAKILEIKERRRSLRDEEKNNNQSEK
jgi:hypothetical protein